MPKLDYRVDISEDAGEENALRFTFVPKNVETSSLEGESALESGQFVARAKQVGATVELEWVQDLPLELKKDLAAIARERMEMRYQWLARLKDLVSTVKAWANELGWSTKVVKKKMNDADVGSYVADALLLQQETVRLFLEPIARDAPGVHGVADLYLMPSYDDLASLYFYNEQWNVHYVTDGGLIDGDLVNAAGRPLTKETLQHVLDEIKSHAE